MIPVLSALSYTLSECEVERSGVPEQPPWNDVTFKLTRHFDCLPAWLRVAMVLLTWVINLFPLPVTGKTWRRLPPASRRLWIERWRRSPLGPLRDWVRFHESLVTLAVHSRTERLP